MSANEIPTSPAPSMQPESSAGPTVALNSNQTAETPVAAAPSAEGRTTNPAGPRQPKPRLTRACEECRVKKMRCHHRQIITPSGNIPVGNRATASQQPVQHVQSAETEQTEQTEQPEQTEQSQQPQQSEEPQTKRVLRAVRRPTHNEEIMSNPVPATKSQPKRNAQASRKGKRKHDETETEEPPVENPANTKGGGDRTLSAKQIGKLPVDKGLNGFGDFKWAESIFDVFQQVVKEADEQWEKACQAREVVDSRWKRTCDAIERSHDKYEAYAEKVNRVNYVLTKWKTEMEKP